GHLDQVEMNDNATVRFSKSSISGTDTCVRCRSFGPHSLPDIQMNQTRGIGTVNVYGLGYIGLPTAAILASVGYDVTGIDIDEAVTRQVQSGLAPHKGEPGLDELLKVNVEAGRLRASTA